MSKNQPSQPTTNGTAVALIHAIGRLVTSTDPEKRSAGYLILAAGFIAYLVDPEFRQLVTLIN